MKFLFAATLLLLSVFGPADILDIIKTKIESIEIRSKDTIQADAKKYYTDMVEGNKEFTQQMEDERKELLEQASKNLEGEALTEEETDINKVYDAWIKLSSEIPSEEKIVEDLEEEQKMQKNLKEAALKMIEAAKLKDPEEQDVAFKALMMEQIESVDPKNAEKAEKEIDEMIKETREASKMFNSFFKEIKDFKPTKEELEAQGTLFGNLFAEEDADFAKLLEEGSLFANLFEEDVKNVEEAKTEASKDRLLNKKN